MNIAPMNRLKDCWPPTNQLGKEERSVSRGSTQAKCYGWLGKYIIRQKGINTITSIYTDLDQFQPKILFLLKVRDSIWWSWSDTDMKQYWKPLSRNINQIANTENLINLEFKYFGVTLPKIHYKHREFLSELKNIHNLFLLN